MWKNAKFSMKTIFFRLNTFSRNDFPFSLKTLTTTHFILGWSSNISHLCKKVTEKKVSGKYKPGNKNFDKKSQFSEVLGRNVAGNKVLSFSFLGLFYQRTFFVQKFRTLFPKTFSAVTCPRLGQLFEFCLLYFSQ